MKELTSKDNIKLYAVVLFSVVILTFWNNFIGKKQREQEEIKNSKNTIEVRSIENKNEAENSISKNESKNEYSISFENFLEKNSQQKQLNLKDFFAKNLDIKKDYKMNIQLIYNDISKDKINKITEINSNDLNVISFVNKLNLEEFKNFKNSTIEYSFSFQKKDFNNVIYVDDKNELIKIEAKKIKKNHEFYLNDFFGISSNYFNFSFVKKGTSKIKISVSENENEYFLHLILNKDDFVLNNNYYYQNFDIFTGGKDVDILQNYAKKFDIKRFEAILDLGFFSIIAKPILIALKTINNYINNYVLSIILITLLLKIITIPLLNSSYKSTQKMKEISPKINQCKEIYKDDKVKMNQAVMQLYKDHKINPFSAMIPMLIQIPILFAFYKVLSNAFFLYGAKGVFWIKDLSAPEGLSIINLFGLLPFVVPVFLNIGPMSLLMGASTWLQQKLSSSGNIDETQQSFMYIMPIFLTFISTSFPSGLLIYWIFSNLFGILHQYLYNYFKK